jgi:hypothetical protein
LILVNAINVSIWESDIDPALLRSSEKNIVVLVEENDTEVDSFVAIFDIRSSTRLTAGLSICRTFFVCFVLAAGALFFSKDANDLVIAPIEAMI